MSSRTPQRPLAASDDRARRVLVVGGTGFIGGRLVARLRAAGVTVRCLVRNPYAARRLRAQSIEAVFGDLTAPDTLQAALDRVGTVLNLSTIIREHERGDFRRVLHDGVRNLLRAAAAAGVARFVQIGALGDAAARGNPRHSYLYWKEKGAALVDASDLDATVIETSVVFGPGDQHFTAIALTLKWLPCFFIPDGAACTTIFQPIHVDDVVACVLRALDGGGELPRRVPVAGPERLTYEGIVRTIASLIGRTPRFVRVSPRITRAALRGIGAAMRYEPVTEPLMDLVGVDSIAEPNGIADVFGITPRPLTERAAYLQAVGLPELAAWVRKRPRHGIFVVDQDVS